jgi:inner membrane protein
MDSLTHAIIGLSVGQVFSNKNDKARPLIWGAIAANIPDLDIIIKPFISPEDAMFFHRGISHSFLLWAICAPLLALVISKMYKGDTYFKWLKITLAAWLSHILLDVFNTYGTGLFEPFSHARVALDAVNVFDLVFLIPILTAAVFLVFVIKDYINKIGLAACTLSFSLIYIMFAVTIKSYIEVSAKIQLIIDHDLIVRDNQIYSSPLPLSIFAWKITAKRGDGYYVGVYHRFWKTIVKFKHITTNERLERDLRGYDNLTKLKQFTKGYYILEQVNGKMFMVDLRFTSLDPDKNALRFPLHLKDNVLEIEPTSLDRHITWKNFKTYFSHISGYYYKKYWSEKLREFYRE